jgi:hypothetical protein
MMYIIKNNKGETVAICTNLSDAKAYLGASKIDKTTYTIVEEKNERHG